MKPLNQAERNNLYLKFFLLFMLTVSLTVLAIFFDFTAPQKLTEVQREKLKLYNAFANKQKDIIKMVDTLNYQILNLENMSGDYSIEKEQISSEIKFKELSGDTSGTNLLVKLNNTFKFFLIAKVKSLDYKKELDKCKNQMQEKESNFKDRLDLEKTKAEINQNPQ